MTYPTSMSGHTRTSRGTPKEKGKIDQYLLSEYSTHSNSNTKKATEISVYISHISNFVQKGSHQKSKTTSVWPKKERKNTQ